VHWTREKPRPRAAETVRTSRVLATPGTVVEQHVPVGQQGDRNQARLVGFADDDAPTWSATARPSSTGALEEIGMVVSWSTASLRQSLRSG